MSIPPKATPRPSFLSAVYLVCGSVQALLRQDESASLDGFSFQCRRGWRGKWRKEGGWSGGREGGGIEGDREGSGEEGGRDGGREAWGARLEGGEREGE